MKISDIVRRSGDNLRQAKGRTILTSLAIAVGALTIALALAAGNGGRAYTDEMVNSSGDLYSLSVYPSHDRAAPKSDQLPEYGAKQEQEPAVKYLSDSDIQKIRGFKGVKTVEPEYYFEPNYVTSENSPKRVANVAVKADRREVMLRAGSLEDNMLKPGQAMLPEGYLESFGFKDAVSAIGKKITINVSQVGSNGSSSKPAKNFELTIVAIDYPSDTSAYYTENIQVSSGDGKTISEYQNGRNNDGRYGALTVLAESGTDMAELQRSVEGAGYSAYSLQDMRQSLMQAVGVAQWGLVGFGALAILASIFGIINTMYISVLERTQQIGLMKALGMRSQDVSKMFRYEAAWIGLLGGAIGVAIAWLVTFLNPVIANFLKLEEGTRLLRMDWTANLILVISLMLVAMLSGYFPSRKAAKLNPVEALRTE